MPPTDHRLDRTPVTRPDADRPRGAVGLDPPPSAAPASDDPMAILRRAALPGDRPERWRAVLTGLGGGSTRGLVAIGVVVAAALVGIGVLVALRAGGRGAQGAEVPDLPFAPGAGATSPGATPGGGNDGSPSTTSESVVVVQAAGAVASPGVYRLPAGARVADLVERAGGLAPDADGDRVNLASPLADGARVYVPRRGETDPPAAVVDGGGGSPGSGGSGGSTRAGTTVPPVVDLNTATAEQLEGLPGVGPATAAAIIDHRRQHGPFRSVDELGDVRGIGDVKLAQLRDLVRV